ncbi:hypothetical protein E2C01_014463 [Portunus trituberculatus]|uniref:Uncharacterized protein n=1 Tax=Portunus trituberculatus TaxID=210409 RepID=A0A5B7DK19_PORTR|nr:hypothetical protein [Portunus trituberculatus]
MLRELLQELNHFKRVRQVLVELVQSHANLLVSLLILWPSVKLDKLGHMATHCQLVFLKLDKSLGGVLVDGGKEVKQLLHSVLWWQLVRFFNLASQPYLLVQCPLLHKVQEVLTVSHDAQVPLGR